MRQSGRMPFTPPSLPTLLARRAFLARGGLSLGSMALSTLLARPLPATTGQTRSSGAISTLHHRPKIKRVIWLYMSGGPSHLETFDYKPALAQMDGKPMPESFTKGQPIAQLQGAKLSCLGPRFAFRKHGKSGTEVADILPHTAKLA